MKRRISELWVGVVALLFFIGCGQSSKSSENGEDSGFSGDAGSVQDSGSDHDDGLPGKPVITIQEIVGSYGDIRISFVLDIPDATTRDVATTYTGGCWDSQDAPALVDGETTGLTSGVHTVTWYSWDQEAGCSGTVRFTLTTDRLESVESEPVAIENTGENSGFLDMPQQDQGINDDEVDAYTASLEALIEDPGVDFVATRIQDTYEVHAARGSVVFRRVPTSRGYRYDIVEVTDQNPLERQDPDWIPSLASELDAGGNPNDVSMPALGYAAGDPRISFIEPEDDSYPYAYERIAAYFDHPDSADLYVNQRGYSHYKNGIGDHGSLDILQSRSPLVFWGAGIAPGEKSIGSRQVDIAPTVAKVLGMPLVSGVDERGVRSRFVYLKQQDGHALEDVLDGGTAERVIIVVADGLAHNELRHKLETRADQYPNLMRLTEEGAWVSHGSITNWPSVTYPSHNVIGSGIYSGHHGLVDNIFYLRSSGQVPDPIEEYVKTEKYWNPVDAEAETLHMAVHRVFGLWQDGQSGGAYTASLFDPSAKGADTADLEYRDRSGQVPFPPVAVYWPPEIPGPNVASSQQTLYRDQLFEQTAMVELYTLFTNGKSPVPRYVIMNFMTTDECGHLYGPHGDCMLLVLKHIDTNLGVLFSWLEKWGLLDTTTIIFTSDHGMQLGDTTRMSYPPDALDQAGVVRAADTGFGVYFNP